MSLQHEKRVFVIVRHGDYDNLNDTLAGRQPFPLSELGRLQSCLVAKYLETKFFHDNQDFIEKIPFAAVFYSAVERTKETAEIIARTLSIAVHRMLPDDRLLETDSVMAGVPGVPIFDEESQQYNFFRFGNESLRDIQDRMVAFWESLVNSSVGNAIICSHGDPIMTLLSSLTQTPLIHDHYRRELNPDGTRKHPFALEKGEAVAVFVEHGAVVKVSDPFNQFAMSDLKICA